MPDRSVSYTFKGNFTNLTAGLAVAGKNVQELGGKLTAADKNGQKMRAGLSHLGSTAGAVGLAAAAGLGLAVAAAARFDASMSKVRAATHESAANMGLLRAAAIKAGADTVFSATEAADAITALAKAGVSTKDVLAGGLAGSLALASAGELDVGQAAEIAATAMTQFGLAGKDIPHIADLLAAGAGKAQGEVSDFAASLKYVGPVAHQMGISIEEATGTIAELASQGILGEQAGTSLRGMLTSLTSPSKLAAKTMKDLGINLYDANGQFVGLRGIAGQLGSTMGKLTNAERDQALGRIFGNEQITAARILYAGGAEAVDKWTAAVNDQGYAAETAAIKMDNLKGDLEQLRGSLETALIGVGEGSQGPLRDFVQGLTKAVNGLNSLPGPAKDVTSALLGITAVTGGALWFGSKVVKGIAETRLALAGLNLTAETTSVRMATLARSGGVAAGVLATLFVAHQLEKDDPTASVKAFTDALDNLGTGGKKAKADLNGVFSASNSSWANITAAKTSIDGLGDAFKALNANGVMKLGQWAHGLFGTWDTRADLATSAFKKADKALTGMLSEGRTTEASDAFEAMAVSITKAGGSTEDLARLLPKYTSAAAAGSGAANVMSDAMTGLIPATNGVTQATGPMGAAVQQSAADLAAQAKALEASRKAANETAHQFFGLGASVNDSKVSLGGWIKDLEKQATALRDFTRNAQTAGKRGLKEGLIAELEAAGPEGALRMKQLADASDTEIARANRAWARGQRAINRYTNVVGGVPPIVATDLVVNGVPVAISAVVALKRLIDSLHDRNIHINVTKNTNATLAEAAANNGGKKHAVGGFISGPGSATSDSIPAYLSNGEYVVRAAAVAKYGTAMFDGLNAMRLAGGGAVGYAAGGRVLSNETPRHELLRFKRALEQSTKAVEKETSTRDDLIQRRDQLASTVSGAFTSDIFAGRITGGSHLTQDPIKALQADIARAGAFQGSLSTLAAKGLSGQAFQSLAETGDVKRAQAFAALSPAEIAQFQTLFNQRQDAAASVGSFAGNQVYSPQIDASNKHLAALNAKTASLEHEVKVLQKIVDKKGGGKIVVNDKSGNPKHTAREVSRRQRHAGAH